MKYNHLYSAIIKGAGTVNTSLSILVGTKTNERSGKEQGVYANYRLPAKDGQRITTFAELVDTLLTVETITLRMPRDTGIKHFKLSVQPVMTGERLACLVAWSQKLELPETTDIPAEEHLAACGIDANTSPDDVFKEDLTAPTESTTPDISGRAKTLEKALAGAK